MACQEEEEGGGGAQIVGGLQLFCVKRICRLQVRPGGSSIPYYSILTEYYLP